LKGSSFFKGAWNFRDIALAYFERIAHYRTCRDGGRRRNRERDSLEESHTQR
jgi:hypothetical protein